jgi:transposase
MSGKAIEVRRDLTPAVLRKKARSEKDGLVAARLLAIASVLDGVDRNTAACSGGMTRQILRDWIVRYNAEGLSGLKDRAKGHKRRGLSTEQEAALQALVLKGPDGDRVRWRCVDLQAEILKRFGVMYHERSVGKILRRLGFVRLTVRPLHPGTDPDAQEAFKRTSQRIWQLSCPTEPGTNRSRSGSKMRQEWDRKALSPGFGDCAAHALE